MSQIEENPQDTPPWKRRKESVPQTSQTETLPDPSLDGLSSSEGALHEIARANDRDSRVQVVEDFENLFFHDDFFRLVGIGLVGGFAVSSLFIVVVLEFTDRKFSETFPDFWYLFPTLTILGFLAWTFLLLKVRVHRRDKKLREIAFGGTGEEPKNAAAKTHQDTSGPRHSESDEEWL
jgi:hypothetical protein